MSLASGLVNFTPPRAGRLLRHDLSFLPAVWAKQDAAVLVDEVDYAWEQYKSTGLSKQCNFIDCNDLSRMASVDMGLEFEPWGWDLPVRVEIIDSRISCNMLSGMYLAMISSLAFSSATMLPIYAPLLVSKSDKPRYSMSPFLSHTNSIPKSITLL